MRCSRSLSRLLKATDQNGEGKPGKGEEIYRAKSRKYVAVPFAFVDLTSNIWKMASPSLTPNVASGSNHAISHAHSHSAHQFSFSFASFDTMLVWLLSVSVLALTLSSGRRCAPILNGTARPDAVGRWVDNSRGYELLGDSS